MTTATAPTEAQQSGKGPSNAGKIRLKANWDAALIYDALRRPQDDEADTTRPVFVGRHELVGALVNAIGEPERRGTYLISGYRGAGKTSLVIEAARNAVSRLHICKRQLLALVLNVSEVSASLDTASKRSMQPLGIDARRLLTALLRALRNELEDVRPITNPKHSLLRQMVERWRMNRRLNPARRMIARAYDKAEASQYSRRAAEAAVSSRTARYRSNLTFRSGNVMRLIGGIALLGAATFAGIAVTDAKLGAVDAAWVALLGVAVVSFTASRVVTRQASQRTSAATELVFDNSLHQVESDLKQILAELDRAGMRTIVVLEELDKIEKNQGEQLDAVIRYFKNLFTQAPALFFFLTDKEYFDSVDRKLAAERKKGSYAVEHTFFTHRVFVSRPALEECLGYFQEVLVTPEALAAVEQIGATRDQRSRTVGQMTVQERFLRVLLFTSQNHLFDLKSEMRRYVSVADDGGADMVFNQRTFPPREQALAAFHFLLEQKLKLFWFGGGRDYANEILRNCLSSTFADLGTDAQQQIADLQPAAIDQADLRRDDRESIKRAIDSLTDELERGKAITTERATTPTVGPGEMLSFRWQRNAVSSFTPNPQLESHETFLREEADRAIRVIGQFGGSAALAGRFLDDSEVADAVAQRQKEIDAFGDPLSLEQAAEISAGVKRDLRDPLAAARTAHHARLAGHGWELQPLNNYGNVFMVPDTPRLLVVNGPEEVGESSAREARAQVEPGPIAVVLVDDDPTAPANAKEALRDNWRTWLSAGTDQPALVTVVTLGEGLERDAVADEWGVLTADELRFSRLWLEQVSLETHVGRPDRVLLFRPVEPEESFPTLEQALSAWLRTPDAILGNPPEAGTDPSELMRVMAVRAAEESELPILLRTEPLTPEADPDPDPYARLIDRGRVIPLWVAPPPSVDRRAVVAVPVCPPVMSGLTVRALALHDDSSALRAVARFYEQVDEPLSNRVYRQVADAGDPPGNSA